MVIDIPLLETKEAQLTWELMGSFTLKLNAPSYTASMNDAIRITYNNKEYTFIVRTVDGSKITAEHISYNLRNSVLVDKYINVPPTYDDRIEFAEISLSDLITALSGNYNDVGFTLVNEATVNTTVDISFGGDNLLSALQKIAEAYNVEYTIDDNTITFKDKPDIEQATALPIRNGYEAKDIDISEDRSDLVTRIYPVGSSENLPEGYYYTNLRPTTFNISTRVHSGTLYVQDDDAITEYGVIEKIVEFPDVSVKSRRGTIDATGSGYLEEYKGDFPFIQADSLIGIDVDRAKNSTLLVVNGLNMAELQVLSVNDTEGKIYYSPYLKDGSTLTWSPAAGNPFVLVGYIGQEEMDDARDRLISMAQAYLRKYSHPQRTISADLIYTGSDNLNVGDVIQLSDPDSLLEQTLNDKVRIMSFTYDFLRECYRNVKLSNESEDIRDYLWKEAIRLREKVDALSSNIQRVEQTTFPPGSAVTPPDIDQPAMPTNLQLVTDVDQLGVSITASWSESPDANTYVVRYSYDNQYFYYLNPITVTTVQFYVEAGTVVYVQVAAVNEQGIFSSWLAGSIQVGGVIEMPPPTDVRANGIFTTVQVSFSFPNDKIAYVSAFEVQVDRSNLFFDPIVVYTQGAVVNVNAENFLEGDESTVYARVRTISRTQTLSSWSGVVQTNIFKVKGEYIATATIGEVNIGEASIKTVHIDEMQVTNSKIANIDASKITTGYLDSNRIKARSIDVEKLVATLYLKGRQIIAGTEEKSFIMDETGIHRKIERAGKVFDKEIGTILAMRELGIPASGTLTYKLPDPLLLEDVEIFLQPLSMPVHYPAASGDSIWRYNVNWRNVDLRTIEIKSYISKDTDRLRIMNGILIPTGSWYSKSTVGPYTDRVSFYVQEMYFPGLYSGHNFSHSYTTPKVYTVKIRWTGTSGSPPCYIQIDWGDGTRSQKQIGSIWTTGIYAWCYAYNYSSSPTIYYTSGDVLLVLIDRRR